MTNENTGLLIGLGLSYLGNKTQSDAAGDAADAQIASSDKAIQAQLAMFYQSREDLTPWRLAGEKGIKGLEDITKQYFATLADPSKYVESPYYQFLMDEGTNALARGASASGKLDSGQYSKDLMQFGQGLASQDFGNYLNRLLAGGNQYASLSGMGQNTAVATGQMGQQTAANVGNLQVGQGNALADQYVNQSNARTGLYQNVGNVLNQYLKTSSTGSGGTAGNALLSGGTATGTGAGLLGVQDASWGPWINATSSGAGGAGAAGGAESVAGMSGGAALGTIAAGITAAPVLGPIITPAMRNLGQKYFGLGKTAPSALEYLRAYVSGSDIPEWGISAQQVKSIDPNMLAQLLGEQRATANNMGNDIQEDFKLSAGQTFDLGNGTRYTVPNDYGASGTFH